MSTGESDYAKRVVELSMQLANSRADVENLRMRIKAVDKEHEQLKKDRADMVDRFDAALQRAKAEGMEKAVQLIQWHISCGFEVNATAALARAAKDIDAVAKQTLDARAAQIEEGEDHGTYQAEA